MTRSFGLSGVLIVWGLMCGGASQAEAQVAGTTFTTYVISPALVVKQGSMQFNADMSFVYTPLGGKAQNATYSETVDATTGDSSLTITGGSGQPITGLAVAATANFTLNGNLPVTLLYGVSGNPSRFYLFIGYYLPTRSS